MYDTRQEPNEFIADSLDEARAKAAAFFEVDEADLKIVVAAEGEIFGAAGRTVIVGVPKNRGNTTFSWPAEGGSGRSGSPAGNPVGGRDRGGGRGDGRNEGRNEGRGEGRGREGRGNETRGRGGRPERGGERGGERGPERRGSAAGAPGAGHASGLSMIPRAPRRKS